MMFSAMALAVALQSSASDPSRFMVYGYNSSCATWLGDSENYRIGKFWLLGFWTGRNSSGGGFVGNSTDSEGIVAEVKLVCEATPSKALVGAALEVYARFRAEGR